MLLRILTYTTTVVTVAYMVLLLALVTRIVRRRPPWSILVGTSLFLAAVWLGVAILEGGWDTWGTAAGWLIAGIVQYVIARHFERRPVLTTTPPPPADRDVITAPHLLNHRQPQAWNRPPR